MKKMLLLVPLVIGLSGCGDRTFMDTVPSHKVHQGSISQNYKVSYYADEEITSLNATFREGTGISAPTIKLTAPSDIRHSRGEMFEEKPFLGGTRYEGRLRGEQLETTFTFVDQTKKQFVNKITLRPLKIAQMTQSKSDGLKVVWEGEPNQISGETVGLLVDGLSLGTTLTVEKNFIQVPSADLAKLGVGKRKITIYRFVRIPLQQGTAIGGDLEGYYHAKSQEITLE